MRAAALPRRDGGRAGLDDPLEGLPFELHLALDGLDEVGDQVVAPLELHVDLAERVGHLVAQAHQAVEREHQVGRQGQQYYG